MSNDTFVPYFFSLRLLFTRDRVLYAGLSSYIYNDEMICPKISRLSYLDENGEALDHLLSKIMQFDEQ